MGQVRIEFSSVQVGDAIGYIPFEPKYFSPESRASRYVQDPVAEGPLLGSSFFCEEGGGFDVGGKLDECEGSMDE